MYEKVQSRNKSSSTSSQKSQSSFGSSTFPVQRKAKKANKPQSNGSYSTEAVDLVATNLMQTVAAPVQRRVPAGHEQESETFPNDNTNQTGLPDNLKAGIENLSGMAMDDVRVYYNSNKPAQLQALAYTQRTQRTTNIYVGPGQEKYLPHEAWHVVQQMQGRVKPTMYLGETPINNAPELETEADVMGAKAAANVNVPATIQCQEVPEEELQRKPMLQLRAAAGGMTVIQRRVAFEFEVPAYEVKQIIQETGATDLRSEDLNDADLEKSDVLARGDGFELQVDTGDRGAHLEFVTSGRGFDETDAGRKQLKKAIEGIVALGNEITNKIEISRRTYKGQGVISTGEITNGLPKSPETVIHGFGMPMKALPQTTAGIRLDRIPALMENMVNPENESAEERERRSPQRSTLAGMSNKDDFEVLREAPRAAKQAITNFKTQMTNDSIELPPNFGSESLVGLMALIYTYLKKATTVVPDELKTLFPLLAHTKFPSMFAMLPDYDREPFTQDPQRFVDINLNAAQMAGTGQTAFYSGDTSEQVPMSAMNKERFGAITRQDWLSSIPQGTYVNLGVTKFQEREGGEQVGQTHLIKNDTITNSPILELRRMVWPLGINSWKDFSLDIFDFIKQLNDLKTQRFTSRRFDLLNQK